jgi:hypothetical protein
VALEAFGPDRLMFGSDWPVCTLVASYGTVVAAARDLTAALSPAERAAIFTGTATRVYGLLGAELMVVMVVIAIITAIISPMSRFRGRPGRFRRP